MPSPINLITDRDDYVYVELGPLPAVRTSYVTGVSARYPFPTPVGAERFAKAHKDLDPYRKIHIDYPDGRRIEVCSSLPATGSVSPGLLTSRSYPRGSRSIA